MKKIDDESFEMLMSSQGQRRASYYGKRSIGSSGIGHDCDAHIQLAMRSFPEVEPSDQSGRRFLLGYEIEKLVIADMRSAGLSIIDSDGVDSHGDPKQILYTGFEGHVKAYIDAMIIWEGEPNEPVEIKSMNAARFKALLAKGPKVAEPKYYDQIQTVLGLSGLPSAMLVAYNKDNSHYRTVRIHFDSERWDYLTLKIERILDGEAYKISPDGSAWQCHMCTRRPACVDKVGPPTAALRCHHCAFAAPDKERKWFCTKHGKEALAVCEDFQLFQPAY